MADQRTSDGKFKCLVCEVEIGDDTPEGHAKRHREQIRRLTDEAQGNQEIKPMNVVTLNRFLDWLEDHRDTPREEMRVSLMYSFLPPRTENLIYFQGEWERYLRREVVDKFLRGEDVAIEELREAVYYLCVFLGQASDAVHSANQRIQRRQFQPPIRR